MSGLTEPVVRKDGVGAPAGERGGKRGEPVPGSASTPSVLAALERARLAQEQHDRRIDVQLTLSSVRAYT